MRSYMCIMYSMYKMYIIGMSCLLCLSVSHLKAEVSGWSNLLQELTVKVREQDQELSTIRKEVAELLSELSQTKYILNGISKALTEGTNFSHKSQ